MIKFIHFTETIITIIRSITFETIGAISFNKSNLALESNVIIDNHNLSI